jgi:hypothetical protein
MQRDKTIEPASDEAVEWAREWANNHLKGAGNMVLGLIARIELSSKPVGPQILFTEEALERIRVAIHGAICIPYDVRWVHNENPCGAAASAVVFALQPEQKGCPST